MQPETFDKCQIKCVAVVQCDACFTQHRGALSALEFLRREHLFDGYGDDVVFVALSCGGCPGKLVPGLSRRLERLTRSVSDMSGDRIVVHLIGPNAPGGCPHRLYVKELIHHQGLNCIENDVQ